MLYICTVSEYFPQKETSVSVAEDNISGPKMKHVCNIAIIEHIIYSTKTARFIQKLGLIGFLWFNTLSSVGEMYLHSKIISLDASRCQSGSVLTASLLMKD